MARPVDELTDIADAIRERGSLSSATLLPVTGATGFAARIRAFVTPSNPANADARRLFHFRDFLTPAEEQANNLWRLDGRPLYASVNPTMHALFKVGPTWQSGLVPFSPNRVFDTFKVVGNKIYVGSSTSLTTISVINTTNGAVTTITGLPSRAYTRFEVVGTWIYCLHPASSAASFNTLVAINTATDAITQIAMPASRAWYGFAKFGNRWFIGSRTATTDLVYLDVTTHPGTITTIPDATSTSRTQHLIVAGANKLYIASPSATDYLGVIDVSLIASNPVRPEIGGLPNRIHDATYLAGRYLYIGSSSTTAYATIIRIDTQTDSLWGEITVPSRKYSINIATNTNAFTGKLVGSKLYVGADTQATTLVVINNTTGAVAEITGLPNRRYEIYDDDTASFANWNVNWVFESSGNVITKRLHTAGAKLYLSSSTTATTLVVLTTNAAWAPTDTFTEITGLASRAYQRFFVYGTTLFLLPNTSATTIEMINLSNDTRLTAISGLTNRTYGVPVATGTGAAARLYLGGSGTNIPIINLSTNALVEDATGLANRVYNTLLIYADKIYVGGTGISQATLLVLSDSVLPSHPQPVYIRPD